MGALQGVNVKSMLSYRSKAFFVTLTVMAVTFLAFWPGVYGPFVFDDFHNIVENDALRLESLAPHEIWDAITSTSAGPLGRPISLLTFALNFYFGGDSVFSFKLTNILIHALNGLLVFFLAYRLIRLYVPERSENSIILAAMLVALAWVLHPLNLTNVLYVVQRMNSLAGLFTLAALLCYVDGREKMLKAQSVGKGLSIVAAGFLVFMPLAALSKENGLLFVGFAAVIELAFFRFQSERFVLLVRGWYALLGLTFLFILLGFFFDWHRYSYASITSSNAYALRDFDLDERLMTQARALWFYLSQIVVPNITSLTLFHDGFGISRSLTSPITTLYSVAAWGLVVTFALYCVLSNRVLGYFGVLWFLVGHSMESSIFSLELIHEHRNYMPMFGILLSVALLVMKAGSYQKLGVVFCVLLTTLFFLGSHTRSYSWGSWGELVHSEVKRAPDSSRSHYQLARWYFSRVEAMELGRSSEEFKAAEEHFLQSITHNRTDITGGLAIIRLYDLVGGPPPQSVTRELTERMRTEVMTADNSNKMMDYLFCQMDGDCSREGELSNQFITAILSNPHLIDRQKELFTKTSAAYTLSMGLVQPYLYYMAEYFRVAEPGDRESWHAFLTILRKTDGREKDLERWSREYEQRFGERFDPKMATRQEAEK